MKTQYDLRIARREAHNVSIIATMEAQAEAHFLVAQAEADRQARAARAAKILNKVRR